MDSRWMTWTSHPCPCLHSLYCLLLTVLFPVSTCIQYLFMLPSPPDQHRCRTSVAMSTCSPLMAHGACWLVNFVNLGFIIQWWYKMCVDKNIRVHTHNSSHFKMDCFLMWFLGAYWIKKQRSFKPIQVYPDDSIWVVTLYHSEKVVCRLIYYKQFSLSLSYHKKWQYQTHTHACQNLECLLSSTQRSPGPPTARECHLSVEQNKHSNRLQPDLELSESLMGGYPEVNEMKYCNTSTKRKWGETSSWKASSITRPRWRDLVSARSYKEVHTQQDVSMSEVSQGAGAISQIT